MEGNLPLEKLTLGKQDYPRLGLPGMGLDFKPLTPSLR